MTTSTAETSLDRNHGSYDAVFHELATIEQRLRDLEMEIDEMSNGKQSHIQAKQRDARDSLERGETKNLVVITPPEENDGSHAVSKFEGIYTFIETGPLELGRGDETRVRIVDVGDNHAEAIALERIESEAAQ